MLRLPPFRYISARSLDEAARLLADYGERAMPVAGGTDLYPNMKRRQFTPEALVGLRGLRELRGIAGDPAQGMTIGALATLTEVAGHPAIRQSYPALAQAAGLVSAPQLRNVGTLGGNLCVDTRCNYYNQTEFWRHSIGYCMKKDGDICLVAPGSPRCWAVSSSDCAPALISLQAHVRLVGPRGERLIPVAALYRDDGIAYLAKQRDEILAEVRLPPADGWRSSYRKLRRRGAFDFPILGVAAALRQEQDGTVSDARIVLGAVASHPVEAAEAARMLEGQRPTPELLEAAAAAAARWAKPLDNADLTISYRKQMAPIYVRRALEELLYEERPDALFDV
jgi:4-hydroxybenzoyl-CoA reductase subunit beta